MAQHEPRMVGHHPTWAMPATAGMPDAVSTIGPQDVRAVTAADDREPREGERGTMNSLIDFVWAMMLFFFWIMAIWIFISCFMDLFRRNDIHGGMKAVWIIVLFVIPLFGCLIYIIARPKVTAQDVQMMAKADAANQAATGVSTADELAKLGQLRDSGAISVPEYDALKAKLLA
jgi:hypothetical protein